MKVNPLILSLRSATTLAVMSVLLACTGLAQTLSVVSGNAQVTPQNNSTVNPLVVLAKDNLGKPMPGQQVTWTITGPGHLVPNTPTFTDKDGLASVYFVGDFQWDGPGFAQSTVVASAANSVSFVVTTSGVNFASGAEFVRADVLTPVLGDVLTTPGPGESAPFVEVRVTANGNQGSLVVPNVGIRLVADHPADRSLACADGTGLTLASNGIAHCVVVFSGAIGSDSFSIEVGGFRTFGPFFFAVTQAQAQTNKVVITKGDGQAALPNLTLPVALTATVEDASNHALPGVSVTWDVVVPQSVSLSNVVSVSDGTGTVSAVATLGSTVGVAQVRVRTSNGGEAIFYLTVRQPAVPSGPAPARFSISGDNQSAPVGTRLANPLTAVVLDADGKPVPNVPVTWRPSPSVSLTSVVSTSNPAGLVSAIATPISSVAPWQVDIQAQGAAPTPFGYAATTIPATFHITVGSGSTTPPATGQGRPRGSASAATISPHRSERRWQIL